VTPSKEDLTAQEYNILTKLFQDDANLIHTFNNAPWESVEMMAKACFLFTEVQLDHLKAKYHE